MTREQRKQLKDLDTTILRYVLALQNLMRERGSIDLEGTNRLIDEMDKSLKLSARGPARSADLTTSQ